MKFYKSAEVRGGWVLIEDSDYQLERCARYNSLTVPEVVTKLENEKLRLGSGLRYEPEYIIAEKLYQKIIARRESIRQQIEQQKKYNTYGQFE